MFRFMFYSSDFFYYLNFSFVLFVCSLAFFINRLMSQLFNTNRVIYCAIVSFAALGTFKKGSNLSHVLQYFKEMDIRD